MLLMKLSIKNVSNNLTKPLDFLVCNAGINNGFGNFFDEDHSHDKNVRSIKCKCFRLYLNYKKP